MPSAHSSVETVPLHAWLAPIAACALAGAKLGGLVPADAPLVLALSGLLLMAAVFAALHHAEIVALRVGEPFGTLVLALAVTVIEGSLIVSMMLSGSPESAELARNTVFATIMLVCNGVLGLCLLSGGMRHRVVTFRPEGSTAAVAVLATLATLTLVLPQFTLSTAGPTYSESQLAFAGIVSLALWAVFVFVQTVRHRDYFLLEDAHGNGESRHVRPSARATVVSLLLLLVSLVAVVALAKVLGPSIEQAVAAGGFPHAVVGIVIAMLVLLPETVAALKAARLGRMQDSLNLALGSALATIGLTIPAVVVVALAMDLPLVLAVPAKEMVLLALTLLLTTMTVSAGRATVMQGAVHLIVFAVFLFLALVP